MNEWNVERRLTDDDLDGLAAYAGLKIERPKELELVAMQLRELLSDVRDWERDGLGLTLSGHGDAFVRPVIVDRPQPSARVVGDE